MEKKILDYIRTLSKADKKTLAQKTLKLTEEVGELAKVILPYENAYATTHRFVDRIRILEELADCYLVLTSIAHDMDFSDEEFEQMVSHKMKTWADLQAREGRVSYPIPYEIHVTVTPTHSDMNLSSFKEACNRLKVKPILLDLHLKDDKIMKDLMTSSIIMGDNRAAFEEMKRISTGLDVEGFSVLREKIETIPWHPAAPSKLHQNAKMPPNCYFECHLNTLCTSDRESALNDIAKKHQAHKSRNAFKKYDDGTYTIMVTFRSYTLLQEDFRERVDSIKRDLLANSFSVEKEIVEFSIYDSKVSHDSAWITA